MSVEIDVYPKDNIDQKLKEFYQKLEEKFDEEETLFYKNLSDCIKIRIISLREIDKKEFKITVKIDNDGINVDRCEI